MTETSDIEKIENVEKTSDEKGDEPAPLRSVHTNSFADVLKHFGISLLVTTYQAGKLVILRENNGIVNTHFRDFKRPMGLVADKNGFMVGCAKEVWTFLNMPELIPKLDPPDKHDACYLPRSQHITNNIDVHEMARASNGELWLVNTRFSCLCTLNAQYSFVPRWHPPFISTLYPDDRCHLNGLCMVDGKPKYVTALGESNKEEGWRENKAKGGFLMDIPTQKPLLSGLSMPHSPRWYQNQLWLLESGNGSLAKANIKEQKIETVAELPGFTRGMDFCGNLAFIGLSQVRESAVFSGIPIAERLKERTCGIWVVDIFTGKTIAFLKFEDAVQEIFAVQVLHGLRFPEIMDWEDELLGSSYMLP